jgi:hypothetical protein
MQNLSSLKSLLVPNSGFIRKAGSRLACFSFRNFILAHSFDSGGDGHYNLNVGIDLLALYFRALSALILAYLDTKSKLHL